MKIRLAREELLPILQAINNVVERRQSLPILGNVLIVAEQGEITFTATDMEVELIVESTANASVDGSVTIPARKLLDICRSLPSEAELAIDLAGEKIRIQSGRSRFSLSTLPAVEYPSIGGFQYLLDVELESYVLRELIENTQFAMAHQDVRYYLNGLLFEFSEGNIRAVATDGHRLALCDRELEIATNGSRQIIIPRKGVSEIIRLIGHTDDKIRLSVGTNHLKIVSKKQSLTTKLIDGRFPDYERVIPVGGDKHVVAERETLKSGLSRTSILSNEKFRGVRLILSKNILKAVAHNPEQEEAEEEIEVDYDGDDMEIGFNVSYLLDVLGVLRSEKVKIDFIDSNSSCLIQNPDDNLSRYVIMPMRL